MSKRIFKTTLLTMVLTLLMSTIGASFMHSKASASELPTSPPINKQQYDPDVFDVNSPTFEQDLRNSEEIYKQLVGEHNNNHQSLIFGKSLKGLKALGKVIKAGGHTLNYILKPFSRKAAVVVKRNARKIGNALEKPQKVSKDYVRKRLIKFGVPKGDAKIATDIIFWII
jgi:hypothetical protein